MSEEPELTGGAWVESLSADLSSMTPPNQPGASTARRTVWVARIGKRVHGVLPGEGVLIVSSLTAFADQMRLDFLLESGSVASDPRSHQFSLQVEDDVRTDYQTPGGGFETDFGVCQGDREITPCPPDSARLLRLHFSLRSPQPWTVPVEERTTLTVALPEPSAG